MFQALREAEGLTRPQLAQLTGRSVNYILKAEQATFPTPPTALVDFWAARNSGTLTNNLAVNTRNPPSLNFGPGNTPKQQGAVGLTNVSMQRSILKSAYFDYQHLQRKRWLGKFVPRPLDTSQLSFCNKWIPANVLIENEWATNGELQELELELSPTEYSVSKGLCVPASVVFRAERDGYIGNSLIDVMYELVEYAKSGELAASNYYDFSLTYAVTDWLERVLFELKEQQARFKTQRKQAVKAGVGAQ